MMSERSCDTQGTDVMADENSALHHNNELHLKNI